MTVAEVLLLRPHVGEARRRGAVGQRDGGGEHRVRAHPEAEVAVEEFVDDEEFLGLGVTGEGDDLVVLPFVVAVAAGAGLGGERGGGAHGDFG